MRDYYFTLSYILTILKNREVVEVIEKKDQYIRVNAADYVTAIWWLKRKITGFHTQHIRVLCYPMHVDVYNPHTRAKIDSFEAVGLSFDANER